MKASIRMHLHFPEICNPFNERTFVFLVFFSPLHPLRAFTDRCSDRLAEVMAAWNDQQKTRLTLGEQSYIRFQQTSATSRSTRNSINSNSTNSCTGVEEKEGGEAPVTPRGIRASPFTIQTG